MPIRLLIVDDHEFVRQGLRVFLSAIRRWRLWGKRPTGLRPWNWPGSYTPMSC
jgi:DNA-binding NarL/FixJ family response regulator